MKEYKIVKVVSRNFIMDFVASLQNLFGKNLVTYETMLNKGINEIWNEINNNNIKLKWYKYQITEINKGAIIILLYGEQK